MYWQNLSSASGKFYAINFNFPNSRCSKFLFLAIIIFYNYLLNASRKYFESVISSLLFVVDFSKWLGFAHPVDCFCKKRKGEERWSGIVQKYFWIHCNCCKLQRNVFGIVGTIWSDGGTRYSSDTVPCLKNMWA